MRNLLLISLTLGLLPATTYAETASEALAHVRSAFQQANAETLRAVLSSDRKTYISLPRLYAKQGYFGSSQTYFIFQEIFAARSSRSVALGVTEESPSNLHARMTWRFVLKGEETERQAAILLMLEHTDDGFTLIDIRSAQP